MGRLRFQEHSISLLRYFWNRIDSIWGVHGDTTVGPLQSTQPPTFLENCSYHDQKIRIPTAQQASHAGKEYSVAFSCLVFL